ncbi:putative amidophosphoribosyltransferase [Kitasatospora sp. GP30]|uniref:ComF family protein n=1 Tax=Kitasatospora sp. GP30 TaxID=3035084 RepID=UPI000CB63FB4|nr:phosphoribosyltransferase family protein [Kitasatospora sp. GP30]MDH6142473.1 putative amidophosphoribosyltransferase [Kitasatospora sp. GP30]
MLTAALDVLLPTPCTGCGGAAGPLCPDCRALLDGLPAQPAGPSPAPPGLPPLHACAAYRDPVRGMLLAHKERGALSLAAPLGAALARAVQAALTTAAAPPAEPVLLIPMPSARSAVRARGQDATRRLARAAARSLRRAGLRCRVAPVLRQARRVADQSGLGATARLANLDHALTVRHPAAAHLTGYHLVLVDDLVTTGASLAEAARALRAAGLEPLAAATVATTVTGGGRVRHPPLPGLPALHRLPRAVHRRGPGGRPQSG